MSRHRKLVIPVLLMSFFLSGCSIPHVILGTAVAVPVKVLDAIEKCVKDIKEDPGWGSEEAKRELDALLEKFGGYRNPDDGSVSIPSDEADSFKEELEKLKEKSEQVSRKVEELEKELEKIT